MLDCGPFSHTVAVPEITAVGSVVTAMFMVVLVAHVAGALDVGVKVYTVEPAAAVVIVAGDHDPAMLLLELAGKATGLAPWQYGPNCVNNGVVFGFTTIDIVVVVAQTPVAEVGVKVYNVVI
jgi:hypothetical protein